MGDRYCYSIIEPEAEVVTMPNQRLYTSAHYCQLGV